MATALSTRRRLILLGYPHAVGGAGTEAWATIKVWRQAEIDVTLIPTWGTPNPEVQARCDSLGCRTVVCYGLHDLMGLGLGPDDIVVGMCNGHFLQSAATLRASSVKLIWSNCMTWPFPLETAFVQEHGPFEAAHFQSEYQRAQLSAMHLRAGAPEDSLVLIRGAFDFDAFPMRPDFFDVRIPGTVCIGRMARPDADKWAPDLWETWQAVADTMTTMGHPTKVRGFALGWEDRLKSKCGPPPAWVTTIPPGGESAIDFLDRLDLLMPVNGGARENWPRVGLEALARGIPIVTHDAWGWREMIADGVSGILRTSTAQMADRAAHLMLDDHGRRMMIVNGRQRLTQLADPKTIGRQWCDLHDYVRDNPPVEPSSRRASRFDALYREARDAAWLNRPLPSAAGERGAFEYGYAQATIAHGQGPDLPSAARRSQPR